MTSYHNNITRIKVVANALAGLKEKTVFVGGATVSLYSTHPAANESRPTDDVDVIVEILKYEQYARFEESLRAVGFSNDLESNVICRYRIRGIIVDVMPIDDSALGFSNRWYKEGIEYLNEIDIDGSKIFIFEAPYFLASKMEAMKSRGMSDLRYSSDFEDIVYLFENRSELPGEMLNTQKSVKKYLQTEFRTLLSLPIIEEAVRSNVEQDFILERSRKVLNIWKEFIGG